MRPPSNSALVVFCIVSAVVVGNWSLIRAFPGPKVFGDEKAYSKYAWADADRGLGSLLPGRLRLTHHPPFNSHVLSQVGPRAGGLYHRQKPEEPPAVYVSTLLWRAAWLNTVLLALAAVGLYWQGVWLGLGTRFSVVPPALLAGLPRVVFHVHAIWSETLHLFLEVAFLGFVLLADRRRTLWLLVPAGVALGFAVLTRVTLMYFVPVAAVGVAWMFRARAERGRVGQQRTRALGALMIFSLSVGAVVGPQLVKNHVAGVGARISTNAWRNIEFGLRRRAPGDGPEVDSVRWRPGSKVYNRARGPKLHPNKLVNRELHARGRVMDFVDSLPLTRHLARQWTKMWSMLLRGNAQFAHAVNADRWGGRSANLRAAVVVDQVLWRALVYAGLVGLALMFWQSPGWLFLAALVGYYLCGLLVAPINARVAVQLAPVLCLSAAGGLAWVVRLVRVRFFPARQMPARRLL